MNVPQIDPSSPQVLFIDDDLTMRKAFRRATARRGLATDVASTATEAIALARFNPYPVIATDLNMPDINGLALIERLRPVRPDATYILVTGTDRLEIPATPKDHGTISSIIPKPWDEVELESTLKRSIQLYNKRRSHDLLPVTGDLTAPIPALLIQSDPTDTRSITSCLEDALLSQYNLQQVPRLKDAIPLLEQNDYGVVIADIALPDARGLDLVQRIQKIAPQTPLLVLSRSTDDAMGLEVVEAGAQDFLHKSNLSADALDRAIRYAIERKKSEQKLMYLAHYDHLTGLANRTLFRDRLENALARSRRHEVQHAIMYVDLDRFKSVNDSMGHDAGDQLLKAVAKRLKNSVREYDTVARLGGDEFAVLLENLPNETDAHQSAERMVEMLREPILIDDVELVVTASIGIAMAPESGQEVDEVLRAADGAMYLSKGEGRDRFHFCSRSTETQPNHRTTSRRMEDELRHALSKNEFELLYQPQQSMRGHGVVGLEALLRWRKEDGSYVSPAEFIPVLEESGLIIEVGAWVLEQACEQFNQWRAQGKNCQRVAVNVSPVQLDCPNFVDQIEACLRRADLNPKFLELEITESQVVKNSGTAKEKLAALRAMGIRIAIDDFGAGFSSLSYLHTFAVDTIKIDRSFICGIECGSTAELLVGGIIGLGHKLGCEVVAEGVETQYQMMVLQQEGIDVIQGYLCGRPETADLVI